MTFFWLYMIIIIYNLTTLCVHDIFPFIFVFMFQFVFFFHITFRFHEHIYTCCIFYIFLVSCLLHMALHILVKYDVYEIIPHSSILIHLFLYENVKLKLWHFHAKLVNFPILHLGQFVILIFQCLDSIFDT